MIFLIIKKVDSLSEKKDLFMPYIKRFVINLAAIALLFQYTQAQPPAEKPIVVVVCSYNNSEWSKNTLDSIFTQNYSNFRLIIVDDCSTDGNQDVIQQYIDQHQLADKVTFIQNNQRKRKLFNLYRVLYECKDDEIVIMIDGDDWLAHPDVFSLINKTYDNEDIWFTYGQYRNVPASQALLWGHKEMGYCRSVPKHIQKKHAYRYYSFIYMHMRTFRAWLFKLVKLEDLIADKIQGFEGNFYPASNDVAMYFPMVEMAHTRIKFIPDIIYIRNLYSDIVGFKVDRTIQLASAREIRKKNCYQTLFSAQKNRLEKYKNAQADMFTICQNSLQDIEEKIKNITQMTTGIHTHYIFFKDTIENKMYGRKLKSLYPHIMFISYNLYGNKSLKNKLLDCLNASSQQHCIVTTDSYNFLENLIISDIIYQLEKTYAYRFYLNRSIDNINSPYIELDDTICAWKFSHSIQGWRNINSINDMILCKKADLLEEIKNARFDTIYGLINTLHYNDASQSKVGLFFKDIKISSLS